MQRFDFKKYRPKPIISLGDRQWPNKHIESSPQWCSVDLRDGNQALINPMTIQQKHQLFDCLIAMGFKQIEVGFPAASQTDFDFIREIIEQNKIPSDVSIQVLTQARDHLIEKTFESLKGANKAIIHVYNSTSVIQRQQVFKLDKPGIIDIALNGAKQVKHYADQYPETEWQFQYSPESFTQTEPDFAIAICNAVIDVWKGAEQPIIINLPATVEVNTPNVYADQIEYFCRHINCRNELIISLHTHNDRGCGVAAAELGILAGADRIEGTLLGNGERTGNMDIITMAMNLYSQGINPQLDMANMDHIVKTVQDCTDIMVHPRHPYAGELVFTAFSGSHQDAINKCLHQQADKAFWDVAYLPINPEDIGRSYDEVIRINSQSGKGGVAYIIEQSLGIKMPRWMQIEFSQVVQQASEEKAAEIESDEIQSLFQATYNMENDFFNIASYQVSKFGDQENLNINLVNNEPEGTSSVMSLSSQASGVMEAFCLALQTIDNDAINIIEYHELSVGKDTQSQAQCFLLASINGKRWGGFGHSKDILEASLQALLSAFNRNRYEGRRLSHVDKAQSA